MHRSERSVAYCDACMHACLLACLHYILLLLLRMWHNDRLNVTLMQPRSLLIDRHRDYQLLILDDNNNNNRVILLCKQNKIKDKILLYPILISIIFHKAKPLPSSIASFMSTNSNKVVYKDVLYQGCTGTLSLLGPGLSFVEQSTAAAADNNNSKKHRWKWNSIEKCTLNKKSSDKALMKLILTNSNAVTLQLPDREKLEALRDDIEARLASKSKASANGSTRSASAAENTSSSANRSAAENTSNSTTRSAGATSSTRSSGSSAEKNTKPVKEKETEKPLNKEKEEEEEEIEVEGQPMPTENAKEQKQTSNRSSVKSSVRKSKNNENKKENKDENEEASTVVAVPVMETEIGMEEDSEVESDEESDVESDEEPTKPTSTRAASKRNQAYTSSITKDDNKDKASTNRVQSVWIDSTASDTNRMSNKLSVQIQEGQNTNGDVYGTSKYFSPFGNQATLIGEAEFEEFAPKYCVCYKFCVNDKERKQTYVRAYENRIEASFPYNPWCCIGDERCMVDYTVVHYFDKPPHRVGMVGYIIPCICCGKPVIYNKIPKACCSLLDMRPCFGEQIMVAPCDCFGLRTCICLGPQCYQSWSCPVFGIMPFKRGDVFLSKWKAALTVYQDNHNIPHEQRAVFYKVEDQCCDQDSGRPIAADTTVARAISMSSQTMERS